MRIKLLSVLLLLLVFTTGCPRSMRQAGQTVGAAGIETSSAIAEYYDTLAENRSLTVEMIALNRGLLGETGVPNVDFYQTQRQELLKRATLFRTVGSTYKSLVELSDYDAKAEVSSAAKDLTEKIDALGVLQLNSGSSGPIPSALFSDLLGTLAQLEQNADIEKGLKAVGELNRGLATLIGKEKVLYKEYSQQLYTQQRQVATVLIDRGLVDRQALLNGVAVRIGLDPLTGSNMAGANLPNPGQPLPNEVKLALVNLATVRSERAEALADGAAEQSELALNLLQKKIETGLKKTPPDVGDVLSVLENLIVYTKELRAIVDPEDN